MSTMALVGLLLVAQLPLAEAEPVVSPRVVETPPSHAIWFSPTGWLLVPVSLAVQQQVTAWLNVGFSAELSTGTALSLEAAVVLFPINSVRGDVGFRETGYAFSFSLGPQFSFGDRPLSGLFVQPKIVVEVQPNVQAIGQTVIAHSEQIGADVGYQIMAGGAYVSLVVGLSAGYGFSQSDSFAGPYLTNNGGSVSDRFVLGFNLHLVRLGFRF